MTSARPRTPEKTDQVNKSSACPSNVSGHFRTNIVSNVQQSVLTLSNGKGERTRAEAMFQAIYFYYEISFLFPTHYCINIDNNLSNNLLLSRNCNRITLACAGALSKYSQLGQSVSISRASSESMCV